MRNCRRTILLALVLACAVSAQQTTRSPTPPNRTLGPEALQKLLSAKVHTEWEAFKIRNKKEYINLLADDFVAVEDDGQGTRNRYKAANEIDQSVIKNYVLNFLKVFPFNYQTALVTYEITMEFPSKSVNRFKRVYISELWIQRSGQWKMRHYQETPVK